MHPRIFVSHLILLDASVGPSMLVTYLYPNPILISEQYVSTIFDIRFRIRKMLSDDLYKRVRRSVCPLRFRQKPGNFMFSKTENQSYQGHRRQTKLIRCILTVITKFTRSISDRRSVTVYSSVALVKFNGNGPFSCK